MAKNKTWKRVTAGLLALAMVAGSAPANVSWKDLLGSTSIKASAESTGKSLPYSYGFEDEEFLTDGWTMQNPSGLNDDGFGVDSDAGRDGGSGFLFNSDDPGENAQYLISPELNAPNGVTVSFDYRGDSAGFPESFKVGYSTTDDSISSFAFGDEIVTNNNDWQTYTETFPAGTKYVAVYYFSNNKLCLYTDNFSFTEPGIVKTDLSTATVTVNTVDQTASVAIGEETVSESEYTVNYTGTTSGGESYDSPIFPNVPGTYTATATAKESSTLYTGSAASEQFTIAPAATYTVIMGDLSDYNVTLGNDITFPYTITTGAIDDYLRHVVTNYKYHGNSDTVISADTTSIMVYYWIDRGDFEEFAYRDIPINITQNGAVTKTDLSGATVTVNTADQTTSVALGDDTVSESEYTVNYTGTTSGGEDYDSSIFPNVPGTYTATVTAKESSTLYTGSASSEQFTIAPAATYTVFMGDPSSYIFPLGTDITFPYTIPAITIAGYLDIIVTKDDIEFMGYPDGNVEINPDTTSITVIYNAMDLVNDAPFAGELTIPINISQNAAVTKTDLSTATVTVNTADQTTSVTLGDDTVSESEYTVNYTGTTYAGENYNSEVFPTQPGTYTATVTANESSESYMGSASSENFSIDFPEMSIFGTFNSWMLDEDYAMAKNNDSYTITLTNLSAGSYDFKFAEGGSTDVLYGYGTVDLDTEYTAEADSNNIAFTLPDEATVAITFNYTTKKFKVALVKEDISGAAVTVNTETKTTSVTFNDEPLPEGEYTLVYKNFVTNEESEEYPTEDGVYTAVVKAKDSSTKYKGTAQSAGFSIGYIYYDFENETQLNDWTLVDYDDDGDGWKLTPENYSGGKLYKALYSNSWISNVGALNADNWAVSPAFTVKSTGTQDFSMKIVSQDKNYLDSYAVYIANADEVSINNINPDKWEVLQDFSKAPGDVTTVDIDLSDYAGQNVYVAVRHKDYDMFRVLIDDVIIPGNAYGVVKTDLSAATVKVNTVNETTTVTLGEETISDSEYTLVYKNTVTNEVFEEYPTEAGFYTATVTAKDSSTEYKGSVRSAVFSVGFIYYDFENENQLNDWTLFDYDGDGNGWNRSNQEENKFKTYFMVSTSYEHNKGVLDPDNWAVSPAFTVNRTGNQNFSMKIVSQDDSALDSYAVYIANADEVSLENLNPDDWTMLQDFSKAPNVITNVDINLSDYAGQKVYVAIRHKDHDQYWLLMDDVKLPGKFITYTKTEASSPNCTEDGNIEYYTGSDDKFYTDVEGVMTPLTDLNDDGQVDINDTVIEATGHSYTYSEDNWEWHINDGTVGASLRFDCDDCDHYEVVNATISSVTTPATCTTAGMIVYTATVNFEGTEYTRTLPLPIAATGHTYTYNQDNWEWHITDDSVSASLRFDCDNCDDYQIVEATINAVTTPANCTEDGMIVYTATANFNGVEYTSTRVVPIVAEGHVYSVPEGNWEWDADAESATATATFVCSECEEEHIVVAEVVETSRTNPSCTEDGSVLYTATASYDGVDASSTYTVILPATGHTYTYNQDNWEWHITDDSVTASLRFDCDDCDYFRIVNATINAVTTPATCTEDGMIVYTATVNFDGVDYTSTREVPIEATGHVYSVPEGNWEWNADAESATATATFVCSECEDEQTVTADVVETSRTDPGCTEDGKIVYTATATYNGVEASDTFTVTIPAKGHKYNKPTWRFISKKAATATFTCEDCDEVIVLNAEVTRKLRIDPTCTASGKEIYSAKVVLDGETYTYDKTLILPATGHAYSAPVWSWTKDNKATAEFTCGTCGDVETIDAVVTSETIKPTFKADGKIIYTATVNFEGKEYTTTKEVKLDKLNGDMTVSYKPGNKCVKLSWTAVENAEKYAVYGYINGSWQKLTEGYDTSYVIENLVPGKEYTVAVLVKIDGIWNADISNAITVTPNKAKPTTPEVTFQPGNGCVKLDWTEVENAEKYAICGFVGGKWKLVEMGYANSYVLKGLKSGTDYKVAVIAKTDGQWNMDFSNAITVTPNEEKPTVYPEITSIDYDAIDHMVTLNWTKVEGATGYAIAVKTAGKWKARAYTDGKTTTLTSPKLKPGMTYEVVICAKVDGKWETENVNSRTFTVTVK